MRVLVALYSFEKGKDIKERAMRSWSRGADLEASAMPQTALEPLGTRSALVTGTRDRKCRGGTRDNSSRWRRRRPSPVARTCDNAAVLMWVFRVTSPLSPVPPGYWSREFAPWSLCFAPPPAHPSANPLSSRRCLREPQTEFFPEMLMLKKTLGPAKKSTQKTFR